MARRIDSTDLDARRRAEFDKAHPEVLRLAKRGAGDDWELGRVLRRITDASLYKSAGYVDFEDYVRRGVRLFSLEHAQRCKAVAAFLREDVEEFGTGLFVAISRHWAKTPGREDPAHVRTHRFTIVVNGRTEEHVLGDPELTSEAIQDATRRLDREQRKDRDPVAAFLVRFIAVLERAMRAVAGFAVKTRRRREATLLHFFAVPDGAVAHFWRALGAALAATDQLSAGERACLRTLDARPSPAEALRAPTRLPPPAARERDPAPAAGKPRPRWGYLHAPRQPPRPDPDAPPEPPRPDSSGPPPRGRIARRPGRRPRFPSR